MTDAKLDSIPGCIAELTDCNVEVAGFAPRWASAAGELKTAEKRYERLYKEALRVAHGANADERAAFAHEVAEASFLKLNPEAREGLSEQIERLAGEVESFKRRFATIERRSSNGQSILAVHRKASELEGYVPAEAMAMARRAA